MGRRIMTYDTFLFDFDGTLVDSMPSFAYYMKRILDENGISYGDDLIKIITPLGNLETAKYFRTLGLELSEEEILFFMNRYAIDEYSLRIPAKNNVEKVLRELHGRGASLNVLTASPHRLLDPCLCRLGLMELFDNVWSCEDFGTTKADPMIYHAAAQKMGRNIGEILFLDDNPFADKTASSAGMKVCGVFDESSAEYEAEMRNMCDYYIRDFSELLTI